MYSKIILATLTVCLFILFPFNLVSQTTFEEYAAEQNRRFQQYIADDENAFNKYKADVEKKWREFIESTRDEWVSYNADLDGLNRVDFKEGIIIIEALVETHSEGDMDVARGKVINQVIGLLSIDNLSGMNPMQGQLKFLDGTPVTAGNVKKFAEQAAAGAEKSIGHFKGKDGVDRMKVRLEIKMAPDHIRKRAEIFLPIARKYAELYKVDIAVVMAMMETESTFNPLAKSPVPAYGLMQIVPKYAGREVNRSVFDQDIAPKPSFLYNPDNNIQFGCAYLHSMRTRQFRKVEDSQKALYMMIAAYNTGPSNVAKAIIGKKRIDNAVKKANVMSRDSLYTHLIENLPSQETRDYLEKVVGRSAQYVEWR